MNWTILLTAVSLSCGVLHAQENRLSPELKKSYLMGKDFIIRAAEKMPDAEYGFKPTPQVRTFGELVAHVAEAHAFICGLGVAPKQDQTKRTSKADLVKYLRDSYVLCDIAVNSLTDAKATQTFKMMGQEQTILSGLWGNVVHDNETYGTMAVYLRLKGQVPPSSEGPPSGDGKKK